MKEAFNAIKARQGTILRVTGTILAIALMAYLLYEQGWAEIEAAVKQIEPWRLVLALAVIMVSRLAVAGRWYTLLRSGGVQITPAQSLQITFAGLFANNFLPTTVGGDVIRLAGALRLKCDAAISTASLIADRLVGMTGMLMAVPLGLPRLMQIHDLRELFPSDSALIQANLAAFPLGNFFLKAWEKGLELLRRLFSALSLWLKQPRALLQALIFTWINMVCLFIMLSLFFRGMGEGISFWMVAGLYSFVYLVALIPISINGYGLQEISMTLVFSRLGGASLASSLTAALLFRTVMMVASLPGVFFVPGLIAYSRQQRKEKTPAAEE